MTRLRTLLASAAGLLALTCAGGSGPPPPTVARVELDRYLGTWYEIASFPMVFQRGCVATTATYSQREDGRIRVVNQCRNERFDGELRRVEGVAWPVDDSNAKLEVRFFWPFTGDYWIVALDPDYRWAVVGNPQRKYLWILSRTPEMDESLYQRLVSRAAALGFDVSRLERTPQEPAPLPSATAPEG